MTSDRHLQDREVRHASDSPHAAAIRIHYESGLPEHCKEFVEKALEVLRRVRGIPASDQKADDGAGINILEITASTTLSTFLHDIEHALSALSKPAEANAVNTVRAICLDDKDNGGLGLKPDAPLADFTSTSEVEENEVLFLLGAWLESIHSSERARNMPAPLSQHRADVGRRPMNLAEKIFAHHALALPNPGGVKPGDFIRVAVDWVLASEVSWTGMMSTFDELGTSTIWRNDRLWLAADHIVDPRINHLPKVARFVKAAEEAKRRFQMTQYQGTNYTILHTEFVRSRAEPGMLVVGSDSHTCSAGAVGCLAIGLGAADTTLPLVIGETWFKVPDSIKINLINAPPPGIGGKDVILYILKELQRNTVAAERVVEFSGPGTKALSIDARFAVANMCTEFGAITGIFVPDPITRSYINSRKLKAYKTSSLYFRPDDNASYAGEFTIDLAKVDSFIALYPSPDNVVPVSSLTSTNSTLQNSKLSHLDGVFIGACTTTLEDLVLGALILEVGLRKFNLSLKPGKRHVVPGSLPIKKKLRQAGLLEVYEKAGFTVGVPGCSFCVGLGADQAGRGEVWLSSQNRNFENRMGPGSIGNIASAATVAASSFCMALTDPAPFLAQLDVKRFNDLRGFARGQESLEDNGLEVVEPNLRREPGSVEPGLVEGGGQDRGTDKQSNEDNETYDAETVIESKIQRLGDFIDTDALAPSEACVTCKNDEELGDHCLEFTHPDFRSRVRSGQAVVVAGTGFGVGSSREAAPRALKGLGVKAVIAKSFAFIYSRNAPNIGLLGIVLPSSSSFWDAAKDGLPIRIDLSTRVVELDGGSGKSRWEFEMSSTEMQLVRSGGVANAYRRFGDGLFERLCRHVDAPVINLGLKTMREEKAEEGPAELRW